VDINLKVKEKGKNSIGLNGGVSGLPARLWAELSDNNFLGLGETLTLFRLAGRLSARCHVRLHRALLPG